MLSMRWLHGLLTRRIGRVVAVGGGVALAVALLASIGAFLASAKSTMTRRAASGVAVDWQVETIGTDPAAVLHTVQSLASTTAAGIVSFGVTSGLRATTGGSLQTTGPGAVVGLPSDYAATFPGSIRPLVGATAGVLLAQQTASNLHTSPGDTVSVGRPGAPDVVLRVDGVIDLPQADSLFQKVGAPAGAQPQAPPDNVVLVPASVWHQLFDPVAVARPDLVHTQVHVRLDHALPNDPSAAFAAVSAAAHHLEATLSGGVAVGDNLAATLDAARGDSLYAQVLFLFLGAPGAVLAALLTAAVAGAGADRRRREQALLRSRGATSRRLVRLAAVEALAIGIPGALAGLLLAAVVGRLAFGTSRFGTTTMNAVGWGLGAAVLGVLIALAVVAVPAWRAARAMTVARARQTIGGSRSPWWFRLGLDLWLLGGAGLVFWLTGRGGYNLVLAPEGTAAISVSYWAFAGPLLLWAGMGLLTWRLAEVVLVRGRRALAAAARPFAGPLSGIVAASMSRERRRLARAVVLVGLTLAFAASTAVFNATYRQQSGVDARLTNGGDVAVTEAPAANVGPAEARRLATVAGVQRVEPLQHRFAYVGTDLQDLYGVNPSTVVDATKLQDAYFRGASARSLMARLGRQPDGLLVSAETVKDFQLHLGDLLRLRLRDASTGQTTAVPFHYIGVAKEFPTAPRDSFLIANAAYVSGRTGSAAVGAFLLDTGSASPSAVAARVRLLVGATATVTDIQTSRKVVGSSLTAVDLSGLTSVELAFALALAAASTGLVFALGLAERRRTLAIASALGAGRRQLGGFVWSEGTFVVVFGVALGAVAAWLLSSMLVRVLTGVFDPAPASLAVPVGYLTAVVGAAVLALLVAGALSLRALRRPVIEVLRGS